MYDIRLGDKNVITEVTFASPSDFGCASKITIHDEGGVAVCDDDFNSYIFIETKKDAEWMIKAIQFAIENDWWE